MSKTFCRVPVTAHWMLFWGTFVFTTGSNCLKKPYTPSNSETCELEHQKSTLAHHLWSFPLDRTFWFQGCSAYMESNIEQTVWKQLFHTGDCFFPMRYKPDDAKTSHQFLSSVGVNVLCLEDASWLVWKIIFLCVFNICFNLFQEDLSGIHSMPQTR